MMVACIANLIQSRGINHMMFLLEKKYESLLDVVKLFDGTYPNPNDTDPTTRNRVNLCETPITIRGNNRRYELGDTKSQH